MSDIASQSIDFKKALLYPFRTENRQDLIWIPGLFYFAIFILSFVLSLAFSFATGDAPPSIVPSQAGNPEEILETIKEISQSSSPMEQLLESIVQFLTGLLSMGYLWHLTARWQSDGPDAPAIPWLGRLGQIIKDGLKLWLYWLVLIVLISIPIIIAIIVSGIMLGGSFALLGQNIPAGALLIFVVVILTLVAMIASWLFIGPLMYAPVLYAASERSLAKLFMWPSAIQAIRPRYRSGMKAMLFVVGLNLLYMIVMFAVALTCIGLLALPFLIFASQASMFHLIYQGLWPQPPTSNAALPASESPA